MLEFVKTNVRWLAGGMLLTLFSAFGQTYFIALSAPMIREDFGLTHGQFGTIYMVATLAAGLLLTYVGRVADHVPVCWVAGITTLCLGAICVFMSINHSLFGLLLLIVGLRLFGQGMMSHTAMTAMGRWYAYNRGRAVAIASSGMQIGEAIIPFIFISIINIIGWRIGWAAGAVLLIGAALPALVLLLRIERVPFGQIQEETGIKPKRQWTRAEAIRDPLFWLVSGLTMLWPFTATVIFFHQAHLVTIRGWDMEIFASAYSLMAGTTVLAALTTGWAVDRYSAIYILPLFPIPVAAACALFAGITSAWVIAPAMILLGMTHGAAATLYGALWPEIYGTRHLGAIRALVTALVVVASALGPGLTGYLIDIGIPYPQQIGAMGMASLLTSILLGLVAIPLKARILRETLAD